MKITSVFQDHSEIPAEFTCLGENHNPPLVFIDVPPEAVSLALLVEDMDATPSVWTHWNLYNIPADTLSIEPGILPEGAVQGLCNNHSIGYEGPCPRYFGGTHRYRFTVYALDKLLPFYQPLEPEQVLEQMQEHLIAEASLIGLCISDKPAPQ